MNRLMMYLAILIVMEGGSLSCDEISNEDYLDCSYEGSLCEPRSGHYVWYNYCTELLPNKNYYYYFEATTTESDGTETVSTYHTYLDMWDDLYATYCL